MKRIVFIFGLLFSVSAFAEGFLGSTIVATREGVKRVDQLKEGDEVLSFADASVLGFGENLQSRKISKVSKGFSGNLVGVYINGKELITDKDQKFFSHEEKKWVKADDLTPGTALVTDHLGLVYVDGIERYESTEMVYSVEVEEDHTLFVDVGGSRVWMHNGPVMGATCAVICKLINAAGCTAGSLIIGTLNPVLATLYAAVCAAMDTAGTGGCFAACMALPGP